MRQTDIFQKGYHSISLVFFTTLTPLIQL